MSPIKMNRLESAIRIAVKYAEAYNLHDIENILKLISDDCVFDTHNPAPQGAICSGKGEIARYIGELFQHNPRAKIEIEEVFGFGHRSVLRWKYFYDSKDKKKYIRGIDIFAEKNDLICEKLSYIKGQQEPPV
jgi:predicted SnoaL-like aldol condensation-catalyzing enzyme